MPPLTDPVLLERFRETLSNWRFAGYVELDGLAEEWLLRQGGVLTRDGFLRILYQFVCVEGNVPDQQLETRPEWRNRWEYHYDLRPVVNGVRLYVEMRMGPDSFASRDEPYLVIVNIHNA